jgi:hypothetical protein
MTTDLNGRTVIIYDEELLCGCAAQGHSFRVAQPRPKGVYCSRHCWIWKLDLPNQANPERKIFFFAKQAQLPSKSGRNHVFGTVFAPIFQ